MEKIKKTMRREDGFTLVELLAVIVILGIILAIAIPAISTVITNSRLDARASEYDMVLDAGRIYLTANPDKTAVTITELFEEGYMELRGEITAVSDMAIVKANDVAVSDSVTYDATTKTYVIDGTTRPGG